MRQIEMNNYQTTIFLNETDTMGALASDGIFIAKSITAINQSVIPTTDMGSVQARLAF